MKRFLPALLFIQIFIHCKVFAQGGTWVWMNGTDTANLSGSYGTMGVASVSNFPPGMYQGVQWTDTSGNLWLFGGLSDGPVYSALWKFDPVANVWTWINGDSVADERADYGTMGVPAPGNHPGARSWGAPSWTDKNGDLWLFGGQGYANNALAELSDLWRYNIANNEWTWMNGPDTGSQTGVYGVLGQAAPSNVPPSRAEVNSSWTDANNNLWLFGGTTTTGIVNDMWQYSIATGEWTWMNGGPGAGDNVPQARWSYTHWDDGQGNFYIYAGGCIYGGCDDVWKFNVDSNDWTLLTGGLTDTPGVYGQYCDETAIITPGAKFENRSTQINNCTPLLLNFGGYSQGLKAYNDLWLFDPVAIEWKWISGDSTGNSAGNYGTKGVTSPSNMPPGRAGPCLWTDKAGNVWLFGGTDAFTAQYFGDLWKFIPDSACLPVISGGAPFAYAVSGFSMCEGDSDTLTITSGTVVSVSPAVTWIDSVHAVLTPDSSTGYHVIGLGGCTMAPDTSGFIITVHSPQAAITAGDSVICPGNSAQICATSGFSLYLWNTGQTTACIYSGIAGNYNVTVTDSNNCSAVSIQFLLKVYPLTEITVTSKDSIICPNDSAKICATTGFSSYLWNTGQTTACIYTNQAGNYYVNVTDTNGCSANSNQFALNVYQVPPVGISVAGDTLFSGSALTYQWFNNGDSIPGANNQIYIAHSAGSYTIQITDSNGCIAVSNPYIISGITQADGESMNVYPNPSLSGSWQVDVSNSMLGSSMKIYDSEGRLVYTSPIVKQHFQIDTRLASGVYFLTIQSSQSRMVRKLVMK